MAAVAIEISGLLYDKLKRTTQNVVLRGTAQLIGLEIGGGPIYPPEAGGSPGVPTHPIVLPGDPSWGDPHPEHPIVMPPSDAHPEHPIVIPPPGEPPTGEPGDDGFVKPPPEGGGWGYHATYGWMYDPPSSKPQPK